MIRPKLGSNKINQSINLWSGNYKSQTYFTNLHEIFHQKWGEGVSSKRLRFWGFGRFAPKHWVEMEKTTKLAYTAQEFQNLLNHFWKSIKWKMKTQMKDVQILGIYSPALIWIFLSSILRWHFFLRKTEREQHQSF